MVPRKLRVLGRFTVRGDGVVSNDQMEGMRMTEPNITFPKREIVEELLGDLTHRSVSLIVAQIIYGHYKNEECYYVQFEQCKDWRVEVPESFILERPLLWRLSAWKESDQRNTMIKTYEHRRRVKRWLEEENIIRCKPFVQEFLGVDESAAHVIASRLVQGNKIQQMRGLGFTNLATKQEELR